MPELPADQAALQEVILESWDRQVQILTNICSLIGETEKNLKPSEDGMPLYEQMCHVHEVRHGWLSSVSPELAETLGHTYKEAGETWEPIEDLEEIRKQLALSASAIGTAMREHLRAGTGRVGPYTHPIHFLQHMIWHEGYHFALITLALRLGGKEPAEVWEERNVWGIWRDPEV
jgi:uncharacterized damage-inducible protein DinB